MDVSINVVGQKLRVATNLRKYVEGSNNFIRFFFNLEPEWDDLTAIARFIQGDDTYSVVLDANNSAYLPNELAPGKCYLTLYGSGSNVTATTSYLELEIDKDIAGEGGGGGGGTVVILPLTVTTNGEYTAPSGVAYSPVIVETSGTDTSDATLDSGDRMLSGYSAYADGVKYTGTIPIRSSSSPTVSGRTVTIPSGYYPSQVTKNVSTGSATTPATTITATPTVTKSGGNIVASVSADKSITPTVSAGYVSSGTAGTVTASGTKTVAATSLDSELVAGNIRGGVTIFGVTGTYSPSSGTDTSDATLTSGSQMLSGYTAYADGVKYTGTIPTKTSSDLTASGRTVTVPSGYYASQVTKSISTGSATTPATTITANPTVTASGGNIVATVSANKSITPSVSAGYVSSGTSGTVTASGSATVAATTLDANLVSGNILSGVSIFGVSGSVTFQHYYTGSTTPSSSLGDDGDLYLQTEE